MALPAFTAEAAVYRSRLAYRGRSGHGAAPAVVVPSLPTASQCESAFDRCFDCIEAGGTVSGCPSCRLLRWCGGTDGGGGGGGGGGLCCEFLANPQAGTNCSWCGATPLF